jgi:putative transposase
VIHADRSTVRYRSRRPDDGSIRVRLRELAAIRRRFGYRRLQILLCREGTHMNHKKLRRLYAEERLQVRRRGGRKRALGTRAPMTLPQGPNQRYPGLLFKAKAIPKNSQPRCRTVENSESIQTPDQKFPPMLAVSPRPFGASAR